MQEECLICQEKLEYLDRDIMMECAVCYKQENSRIIHKIADMLQK